MNFFLIFDVKYYKYPSYKHDVLIVSNELHIKQTNVSHKTKQVISF